MIALLITLITTISDPCLSLWEHHSIIMQDYARPRRPGPALGEQDLRIRRFVSDPLFYPPRVAAVRPLRAAGAWLDGAREASSNHLLPSRKLEHGGAGSG